ncbi:MAG: hypothetical protein C4589_08360 [Peptococcaceae bacterium]|nr:MAG: hypothetical protein C4589_08360 [Peptococcaceae bacterium]
MIEGKELTGLPTQDRGKQRVVGIIAFIVFLVLAPAICLIADGNSRTVLLEERLSDSGIKGVAVIVDGEEKLVLKSRAEAENLITWLKTVYPAEPDAVVGFKETVELTEVIISGREAVDFDTAKSLIQPLVTVTFSFRVAVREEVPFLVEVRKDSQLPRGEQKVVRKGAPGEKIVTYQVTGENGLETGRVAVAEEMVQEVVPAVVTRGSQVMLASRGSVVRLYQPVPGGVISPYGWRDGRMHEGVDLAAGVGSPVVAAAGGTVTNTGWEDGYGKIVEISHGGGLVTRYAHLSSIKVSVGQAVSERELIGLAGATGNASGPHLHFEVIVNGRQRNPAGYIF